jgi:hypothetical protein
MPGLDPGIHAAIAVSLPGWIAGLIPGSGPGTAMTMEESGRRFGRSRKTGNRHART